MIPHTTWHEYLKLRKKEGEDIQSGGNSQVIVRSDGGQIFRGWLNAWLPMGWDERIPSFALLAYVAFALPVKQSVFQLMTFAFFPLIFSPIPLVAGVSEQLCGA